MKCCLESENDTVFTNIENIHNTSNKVDKILMQDFNAKYINKNTNSPHKNIYLFNQNLLKNLKSPVFKKLNVQTRYNSNRYIHKKRG